MAGDRGFGGAAWSNCLIRPRPIFCLPLLGFIVEVGSVCAGGTEEGKIWESRLPWHDEYPRYFWALRFSVPANQLWCFCSDLHISRFYSEGRGRASSEPASCAFPGFSASTYLAEVLVPSLAPWSAILLPWAPHLAAAGASWYLSCCGSGAAVAYCQGQTALSYRYPSSSFPSFPCGPLSCLSFAHRSGAARYLLCADFSYPCPSS